MNYEWWSIRLQLYIFGWALCKGIHKSKGSKTEKQSNWKLPHSTLLTFVSAAFDDISIGFLLSYSYIKGADCLQWLFKKSISMQRENRKQFKDTVQKHSNLVYTTHKTNVPGWHSAVSQKALHLHPLSLHYAV